ncbi:hypothetical protein TWF569_004581 [Orbilia oligospora]|uniref:Uncharacterized protein n=1 Tax=Orbilia oligospora TaxID=2813651 RepID=A0A7C8N9M9_ORBOL|nr:hypothetical protein TWF102_008315 [Orbilia oligospora]KAF3093693.1 hypothetical protein TWF103_010762 [Orbilia oligospora]KAF3114914.1 hypothetical protein TWF706_007061 [Orbilia oligospora]KAF3144334.1 hypothetical protein TWF594_004857 [Orbilia oligospora]KAF3150713.1 hypothetical protein TWF569_004581 [Orbilia oligospora]
MSDVPKKSTVDLDSYTPLLNFGKGHGHAYEIKRGWQMDTPKGSNSQEQFPGIGTGRLWFAGPTFQQEYMEGSSSSGQGVREYCVLPRDALA